jgi:hypothetical protein
MTIGFAATHLTSESAALLLAADCRYSTATAATDTGIKTHALDRTTGAVVAGNALSVASAIELTRGIAADHNHLQPDKPINFYSTVRLFSFFLDQIEQKSPWSKGCEVVLTGFLSNGTPALAKVWTGPSRRAEAHIYAPKSTGSLFLFVGQREGKEQIFSSVGQALREGGPHWVQRAVGTIAYLCEHEGERTIGGVPSVAVCSRHEPMNWPLLVMGNRTYLRGFDVTAMVPPPAPGSGDQCLHVHYDQAWHARVDQNRTDVAIKKDEGFASVSWYIDAWVPASDAFNWKVEPEALTGLPDLTSPPQYVGITRPGEVSWTQHQEATTSGL